MTTEAESIVRLASAASHQPTLIKTESGREILLMPEGMKQSIVSEVNCVEDILPGHIKQAVTVQTEQSLVEYANIFKTDETILFADIMANRIVAAIDYHAASGPKHVAHMATLTLPFSVEWKTWTGINERLLPQLTFARFLEENLADIAEPSGADILEACRDLQAVRKVHFEKAVRTDTDNENFKYTDETEAKSRGAVELPRKFRLAIPVYFDDALVELWAHLRWKLEEGALTLGVALHRHEHVRQATFMHIVEEVASATACPAVFGHIGADD